MAKATDDLVPVGRGYSPSLPVSIRKIPLEFGLFETLVLKTRWELNTGWLVRLCVILGRRSGEGRAHLVLKDPECVQA